MLFNSFTFLVFLPIVLAGHALLQGRALRYWLLGASYVFYGWGQPWWYTLLLVFSTVLDYTASLKIHAAQTPRGRKAWLWVSVVGNLGLLGTFKYLSYLAETANHFSGWLHVGFRLPVPELPLPVGISFYTFQTMAYTIDVYRRQLAPTRSFTTMGLYVAFFPQLVAGPIERAGHLMNQLETRQTRTEDDVIAGITRTIYGLLKKVVFADWLGVMVNQVYGHVGQVTTWDMVLATYGFAFQIYLDFSAYSDIAIGTSRTMGISILENFRWPFLARNAAEYWQRWHISLSTWLRDYLYFPLGGSKKGAARQVLNIFLVMMLGGLWHGASHNFVLWGLWVGLGIALYHIYRVVLLGGRKDDMERPLAWGDTIPIFLTFHWMVVSRVFFRSTSLDEIGLILHRVFLQPWGEMNFAVPPADVRRSLFLMALTMVVQIAGRQGIGVRWLRSPVSIGVFWGVAAALALLGFAPVSEQFIYFQF